MKQPSQAERRKVEIEIDNAKGTLKDASQRSTALGEPPSPALTEYLQSVIAQLDGLRARLADTQLSRNELDAISDRVKELTRARAYFMPSAEIKPETEMMIDDMRSMGLPPDILAYQQKLAAQVMPDAAPNRAAFEELLTEYDYWDDYTDWYLARVKQVASLLCVISAVCTATAIVLCWYKLTFLGFLFAGAVGAGISILLKLPPMTVYGEAASLGFRTAGRYAAGVAGTIAGYGLLAMGMIRIGAGDPAMNVLDPCSPHMCWQKTAGIIIAIGILLGFSERALTSFEEIVFPTEKKK